MKLRTGEFLLGFVGPVVRLRRTFAMLAPNRQKSCVDAGNRAPEPEIFHRRPREKKSSGLRPAACQTQSSPECARLPISFAPPYANMELFVISRRTPTTFGKRRAGGAASGVPACRGARDGGPKIHRGVITRPASSPADRRLPFLPVTQAIHDKPASYAAIERCRQAAGTLFQDGDAVFERVLCPRMKRSPAARGPYRDELSIEPPPIERDRATLRIKRLVLSWRISPKRELATLRDACSPTPAAPFAPVISPAKFLRVRVSPIKTLLFGVACTPPTSAKNFLSVDYQIARLGSLAFRKKTGH